MNELVFYKEEFNLNLFIEELKSADAALKAKVAGVKELLPRLVVYLSAPLTTNENTLLTQVIANHTASEYTYPAVLDLADKEFLSRPLGKIDFTKHLKEGIVLTKSLVKAPNGRPLYAEYTYLDQKIAKIDWTFIDAPGGLYAKKELYLSYYSTDGTEGHRYLIKSVSIDFTIPNQLAESIDERITARKSIVSEVKAVCSGAIQYNLQLSLEDVVRKIQPFWNATREDRANFIELAAHDWMSVILSMTDEDYDWLGITLPGQTITCQQYMLYRLGY
jgi:hypothetical protein